MQPEERRVLPEAQLLVMAERMLVEVLGRIRPGDHDIVLPGVHRCDGRALTMAQAVAQQVEDDVALAAVLGVDVKALPLGRSTQEEVAQAAEAACAAVEQVVDGDARVATPDGPLPVGEHLLRTTVARSLLAHYVAAYLGSTACPLPEELARPLWERTAPEAARWRELGWFGVPMPLPPHVSWRDRFLLTAGHAPHPLGH